MFKTCLWNTAKFNFEHCMASFYGHSKIQNESVMFETVSESVSGYGVRRAQATS